MKKVITSIFALLLTVLIGLDSASAHHGTANDYWHLYWGPGVRSHIQYEVDIVNQSGGSYYVETSINDWNGAQNYIKFSPWDSSRYPNPFVWITVNSYPMSSWGQAVTNPSWQSTSDVELITGTAKVNSRTIENSINNNGRPPSIRRKVVTHELGHILGLAHPSDENRRSIMQQGWNGYSFVQSSDIDWIKFRYTNTGLGSNLMIADNFYIQKPEALIDWIQYDTIQELYDDSDLVVKATINKNNMLELHKDKEPYTVSDLIITEVYKGDYESQKFQDYKNIKMGDIGGNYPGTDQYSVFNNTMLEEEKSYYLFLEKVNPADYNYKVPFDYFPVGGPVGKVLVTEEISIDELNGDVTQWSKEEFEKSLKGQ